jgi:hypothetical protein
MYLLVMYFRMFECTYRCRISNLRQFDGYKDRSSVRRRCLPDVITHEININHNNMHTHNILYVPRFKSKIRKSW